MAWEERSLGDSFRGTDAVPFGFRVFEMRLQCTPIFSQGLLLLTAVCPIALNQHGKVHLVRIELWSIHTGKLALIVHQHAAAAAHAGAVNHDGIEAHESANVLAARHVGYGPH